ncbi:hypothetical protein CEXT_189041 [Caerostris extrusa]|uniref:Uncharacterized protein n=1 Tax=Caerostris extrusa TaxID=172846 RepID=A0AAV4X2H5_CAEEX|nr:hypothetical protein CEXT_189041 [Caerostris extrusa]
MNVYRDVCISFHTEVILDILESVGALDLMGFSESGIAVWTLSAGAGEAFAAVVLWRRNRRGVSGYLHSLSEITGPIKDTDLNWVRELLEKVNTLDYWLKSNGENNPLTVHKLLQDVKKGLQKRPLQQRLGWGVQRKKY